jgi:hypothetical protein
LYPRKWMCPQSPHSFLKHPIYRTAANGWGDAKNQAKMFIVHCDPQIKKKQSEIAIGTKRSRTSVDVKQCPSSQKDSQEASQRHSGSILSDGERMFHWRSCIESSLEIPPVGQLVIEEGNGGLEYYYDIVVIILSSESDEGTVDCRWMRRRAPWWK